MRPEGQKIRSELHESQHPAPTPEDGKALIYFVADGHLTSIFGVDGKWVGAVNGGRYFFVPIEPGKHHLCAMRQSPFLGGPRISVHSLKAEPGGSYYFRVRMFEVYGAYALQLDQLDSDEGRWFVAGSKFGTSHPNE